MMSRIEEDTITEIQSPKKKKTTIAILDEIGQSSLDLYPYLEQEHKKATLILATEETEKNQERIKEKATEEEKNALFATIRNHLTAHTILTIQTEKTLIKILETFQLVHSSKPLDLLLLKNVAQQLSSELPLLKTKSEKIVLPNQKMFEYCVFEFSKGEKKKTGFLFILLLYFVFDFGFKIDHLSYLTKKDLLQIQNNKLILKGQNYLVTERAKKNFSFIQQYVDKEYFTNQSLFSSLESKSLARNFNKKLKAIAIIWNQGWTLQDFRFSFVRNIFLYEEPDFEDFCNHYGVTMPRIYQLRTKKYYSIQNLIEKSADVPYLKYIDVLHSPEIE